LLIGYGFYASMQKNEVFKTILTNIVDKPPQRPFFNKPPQRPFL
jgi:hypothetical protein